jgi:ATP-dependent Lhr-like helicase
VALYLADKLPLLALSRPDPNPLSEKEERLLATLGASGASFFAQLHEALGGGFPGETLDALWSLVWRGLVTNDSLHALRAYANRPEATRGGRDTRKQHGSRQQAAAFRSRRTTPATAQGRWSLVAGRNAAQQSPGKRDTSGYSSTESTHALAHQLLSRYGILLRECAAAENIPNGFSAIYPVLKALEESGRIRRGYFVAGLGATQFALPAAIDLLRSLRNSAAPSNSGDSKPEFVLLAATDPANPYGSTLKWPDLPAEAADTETAPRVVTRTAYAQVILCAGRLVAWLRRGNPNLLVFLPADEPDRSYLADGLAQFLATQGLDRLRRDDTGHATGYLISTINGIPVGAHPMAQSLHSAGFHPGPLGMALRRPAKPPMGAQNSALAANRLSPQQAAFNRPALTRPD